MCMLGSLQHAISNRLCRSRPCYQTSTDSYLVRPSGSGSRWKPVKSCRACTFHGRLRAKMLRQLQTGPRMSPWLFSPLHVKFKDFTLFLEFEDDLELSMSNSSLSNPCKSTLLTGVAGNFIFGQWWCLNQPAKRFQVGNLVRTLLAMAMALSLFLHSWLCGHFSPRAPALPYTSKSTMVQQWLRRFLTNGASK